MRTHQQGVSRTPKSYGESSRFEISEFNATIDQLGYECVLWKEIQCPCRSNNDETYHSTCRNCGGSGHVFVNPTQIRAIITNLDYRSQQEIYGTLEAGMITVTVKDDYKLAPMDKIVLLDAIGEFQENLYPFMDEGLLKTYTRFDVESVYYMGMFKDDSSPLLIMKEGEDFETEHNIIKLDEKYNNLLDVRLTVRYQHKPVYYIKDVLNYARTSKKSDGTPIRLPVKASAIRGAVLDKENMDGTRLLDNSFNMNCKNDKVSDQEKFTRRIKYSDPKNIFDQMSDAQKQELVDYTTMLKLPRQIPFKVL